RVSLAEHLVGSACPGCGQRARNHSASRTPGAARDLLNSNVAPQRRGAPHTKTNCGQRGPMGDERAPVGPRSVSRSGQRMGKPGRLRLVTCAAALIAAASAPGPEKPQLKLGFVKLTDCAPLVVAKELGFFEAEGLDVELEAQANWKILLDRVIGGELDGAQMLAGQPLGAAVGIGTKAQLVTGLSLDLHGNACTVSNEIWKSMQAKTPALATALPPHPISAAALRPVV